MSARFSRPNTVLSYTERKRIAREIETRKRRIDGFHDGVPDRLKRFMDDSFREDPGMLRRRIAQLGKVLSNGSPDSLSKREIVARERMISEDKEWLQKRMVPKAHYYMQEKSDNRAEFQKVVQGCMNEQTPEFKKRAARLKNNLREIDPDNPNASNLETIRPDS